jgi:hypothetical protein
MNKFALITATALALFAAGCSEEQPSEGNPPASQSQTEPSSAERAVDRLKEAAGLAGQAAREEAGKLRQQAEEVLEDAGPLMDQAGRLATQLRGRLETYADQAAKDLSQAAQDLDRRIREATGTPVQAPGDATATLPPASELNADTRAAAAPRPAGSVPDYVGVWAENSAACSRIDGNDAANFAVITPTTVRQSESVCNMATPALQDGKATAQGSCFADGKEEARQIELELPSADTLRIATGSGSQATLTRCHLPG